MFDHLKEMVCAELEAELIRVELEAELIRVRENHALAIDDIQRWIKRWRTEGDEVDRLREKVAALEMTDCQSCKEWEAAAGEDDALKENARLREELEDLAEERDEYREQVQNFQDELASLHEQRESLYRESNKVFSEIIGLREQRAEMVRLFEADEAAADVERDAHKAELAKLRERWRSAEKDLESSMLELAECRELLDHVRAMRLQENSDNMAEIQRLRAFHQDPVEIARLREKVALAQNVALAWGDGDNDRLQVALLSLFLSLYGQAPRNAVEEEAT